MKKTNYTSTSTTISEETKKYLKENGMTLAGAIRLIPELTKARTEKNKLETENTKLKQEIEKKTIRNLELENTILRITNKKEIEEQK